MTQTLLICLIQVMTIILKSFHVLCHCIMAVLYDVRFKYKNFTIFVSSIYQSLNSLFSTIHYKNTNMIQNQKQTQNNGTTKIQIMLCVESWAVYGVCKSDLNIGSFKSNSHPKSKTMKIFIFSNLIMLEAIIK